ncbi:alcohol dehydrogenase [Flavobacterium piscis]|uniref:Alcohol dehydrogenase n=1 Tax=Flavobacterium piscis TaxID=1114874 RepID=A0ABX2XPS2_9FLAO|nr:alcohol dehydrogenase [Flavobacterium piscis]OXG02381.1 alcohol dehydrogenase [Flavobacterium piscis]
MDDKMTAALKTEKGDFSIAEVQIPQLQKPDWVLAKVQVAGICGTDLRHWKVEDPHLACKIMGHELAGEVVSVGPEVTHVKPGDRVVIETVLGDDSCTWCNIQQYNLCPDLYKVRMESVSQAFAQYVSGPAKKFYKLPDHVSYEEAALLDTFSVGLHAVQLSGLKINDKVAIIGSGSIGLGQLQLAKIAGADVIIFDIVDSSLQLAKELGADVTVNTKKEDGYQKLMEFTNQLGADITFECAGGTAMEMTLPQAATYTRIGGKVVIVGGFDKGKTTTEMDWNRIQMGEIKLIPSASYSYWDIYPEMQICLDLLSKGKLNAKKMITHRFPIEKINDAFTTARDKENSNALFVALNIS